MIDSIRLTLPLSMHRRSEMLDLMFSPTCGHPGGNCQHPPRWKLNQPDSGSALPWITWRRAPDGFEYLTTGASLPKLTFGSNVEMVQTQVDVEKALVAISRYISEAARVFFDAETANVSRVDFCHNWKLTPVEVCEYLRVLGRTSLSRMTRTLIDTSTVQFSNGRHGVVFYDKLKEVLSRLQDGKASDEEVMASVGVLRFERRFLNYRACEGLASKFGLANRKAGTLLRVSIAESAMNETMTELGLDKRLESGDLRLVRLLQAYEPRRALALMGFLQACNIYGGEVETLVRLGIPRSTYYKMCHDAKLAGAWLVTDRRRTLPPLRLIQPAERVRVA